jgi:hypothetical protein
MFILNFGSLNRSDPHTGWDEARGFGEFLVSRKDVDYLRNSYPSVDTEPELLELSNIFTNRFLSDKGNLTQWVEDQFSHQHEERTRDRTLKRERRRR